MHETKTRGNGKGPPNYDFSIFSIATMRHALEIDGQPEPNRGGFILCPFHGERTPSFHLVGEKGRESNFKCHGCGEGGGIADYLVKRGLAISNQDAALLLERHLDVTTPSTSKHHVNGNGTTKTAASGPKIKKLAFLAELDAGCAFAETFKDRMRYCEKAGGWFLWDAARWKRDEDNSVLNFASQYVRLLADSASEIEDLDERKKVLTFAISLRKRRILENLVTIASYQDGIAVGDPSRFDADPWLLNVNNGTIDLRTGELLSHDRSNLITRLVPITYDRQATCPRWHQFLNEIFAGDPETVEFVQRAAGYSLTGSNKEHALFVLWGRGANGKSTFLSALSAVLGDYGENTTPETFLDRKAGALTNDLARLRGARFVTSIETGERQALAENFTKAVTGGDRISARFLYHEFFEFEPVFKLWLGTNHRPIIRNNDYGIWRRIRLVPFEQCFKGDRDDKDLRAKLEAELPGILRWAVEGCLQWQQVGLTPPTTVTKATESYKEDMDALRPFLDEQCIMRPDAEAGSGDLYKAYKTWAEANGERPMTQTSFGNRLSDEGFGTFRDTKGRKRRRGIGLKSTDGPNS